eukprot:7944511-Pyramimonas_sp.AAC.1
MSTFQRRWENRDMAWNAAGVRTSPALHSVGSTMGRVTAERSPHVGIVTPPRRPVPWISSSLGGGKSCDHGPRDQQQSVSAGSAGSRARGTPAERTEVTSRPARDHCGVKAGMGVDFMDVACAGAAAPTLSASPTCRTFTGVEPTSSFASPG